MCVCVCVHAECLSITFPAMIFVLVCSERKKGKGEEGGGTQQIIKRRMEGREEVKSLDCTDSV